MTLTLIYVNLEMSDCKREIGYGNRLVLASLGSAEKVRAGARLQEPSGLLVSCSTELSRQKES